MSFRLIFVFFSLFYCCTSWSDTIRLGMSAPFTGPAKELGTELRFGASLYFEQYNNTKSGRMNPIELITYDDGYEPNSTILNTRKLILEDQVFALFNYVGTPTSEAIYPLLLKHKTLFLSPFTGAEFLRAPFNREIFNIRASYFEEAQKQIDYFIGDQKKIRPALFIQADAFGIAASKGFIDVLKKHNIDDIAQLRYQRNTSNIEKAIAYFKREKPDIIFCVGTYEPLSELINSLRAAGIDSTITTLSFAGAEPLYDRLHSYNDVYITTVVENPTTSSLAIVKEYRKAIGNNLPNHQSLEGYINAAAFVKIISQVKGPLTQEKFIKAAESKAIDLKGLRLSFTDVKHQAMENTILNKFTPNGLIAIK